MSDQAFIDQIDQALAEDKSRRIYIYTEEGAPGWIESVTVVDDEIRIQVEFPR